MQQRVAELRELLESEQGAAIPDLPGDPRVRQAIMQDPGSTTPDSTTQGDAPSATAGEMMDDMLSRLRTSLGNILAGLHLIPAQMAVVLDRTRAQVPASERLRRFGAVLGFLAGGIAAQYLFDRLARKWRTHIGAMTLHTARERARVVGERLLIDVLVTGWSTTARCSG